MNTIIIATVFIFAKAPAVPAPLCPASDWRPSAVVGVQVRDMKVCK